MPSNRTSFRDETDYVHFNPGATGLHHLHSHRAAAPADRSSDALALDLPHVRGSALRGTKTDTAPRSQMHGMLLLMTVAALWGSSSPVMKFLFSQPSPPSAALMTAAQAILAAAFLLAGSLGSSSSHHAWREGKLGPCTTAPTSQPWRPKSAAPSLTVGLYFFLTRSLSQLRSTLRSWAAAWRSWTAGPMRRGIWRGTGRENGLGLPSWMSYFSLRQTLHAGLATSGSSSSGIAGVVGALEGKEEREEEDQEKHKHKVMGGGTARIDGTFSAPSRDGRDGATVGGGMAPFTNTTQDESSRMLSRKSEEPPPALQPMVNGLAAVSSLGQPTTDATDAGATVCVRGRSRGINLLAVPLGSLAAVGLELGTYSFCAAALGTWGVQRISATKVAFLGQATSLITPVLVALSGQAVAMVVWGACCFGVLGAALVALDGSTRAAVAAAAVAAAAAEGTKELGAAAVGIDAGHLTPPLLQVAMDVGASVAGGGGSGGHLGVSRAMRLETGGADGGGSGALGLSSGTAQLHPGFGWVRTSLPPALSQESMGANYVLASCLFYALGTVRLGVHSGRFAPLDLAAASALVYAALSSVWLLAEMLGTPTGGRSDFTVVGVLLRDHVTLAMVLWAGFGPGALSSYLQVLGQRIVPAARAQMLYSSSPFWSALIARVLLHGRDGAMGPLAWLGGSVMLSASLIASLLDSKKQQSSSSSSS